MRHVLAPIREEPGDREGEGERIIAAAGAAIKPVSFKQFNQIAKKRLANGTAEKAWESSGAKTEPFKTPKIL
jgi:hypothetical protein